MACDRFVYWQENKPTREQIYQFVCNFLGGVVYSITEECGRYMVTLPGRNTFPFKGLGHPHEEVWKERFAPPYHTRFIEVWYDEECVDFITREADEYTNVLAEGMAKAVARYWQGRLDK